MENGFAVNKKSLAGHYQRSPGLVAVASGWRRFIFLVGGIGS
jgi:hypothetical protein